jgi:hypothetical protein
VTHPGGGLEVRGLEDLTAMLGFEDNLADGTPLDRTRRCVVVQEKVSLASHSHTFPCCNRLVLRPAGQTSEMQVARSLMRRVWQLSFEGLSTIKQFSHPR